MQRFDLTFEATGSETRSNTRYTDTAVPLVIWHLLSLDAPTVAVTWTIFTAVVTHTALPLAVPAAMALAVWTLYAADRLLDTHQLCSINGEDCSPELEPRHLFHHRHRFAFTIGIAVASLGLATLLPLLPINAIYLYLTEGAVMSGYFLLIHAAPKPDVNSSRTYRASARGIPKEILVGPFFAAAIFIPTVSRHPELRPALLPLAVLFAALCSLNCLYIYRWEHPPGTMSLWITKIFVRFLDGLTLSFFAVSGLLILLLHSHPQSTYQLELYPLACAASALILFVLHKLRHRLSATTLRASADAALLTPLIILPFLSWH